ncbi:uncharacterized protein LACBIDRAFT_310842 [Laccaria bicolor S238N-H82]|uniref:Predicted protein n=1 Tax=Laccaria bicolor (strain S238N-H82 / ATCC MYA-4686) TaxID=486041 RepID=B0DV75_LACBS|nr:uncharacterized protein LACBIDRAFT_310842 [Laccaria bicolor S238N-H82]EDR01530.1 predicted protein [Laccaria bicolor S238N-H82]|eukprot:XP_001887882.1 predicted protein [Laccaria bicolor S238N-H82]
MPSIPAYTVLFLSFFILPSIAFPRLPRQLDTNFEGHNSESPPTTSALGSILPEPPKPKCAYSCPQRDGANRVLIAKVNALGYEQGYSIFECVYAPPEAYDDARTCSYHKTSGKQALSSKAISCPAQAPSCETPSSSFSYTSSVSNPPTQYHKMPAKPLFSKQDDIIPEIPTWVETGRYMLWVKEHSGQ